MAVRDISLATSLPQVLFAGRSNVGKSSLLNALLGRGVKRMNVSRTPGRTQRLQAAVVDESFALVDLPGYGFAKAPVNVVRHWQNDVADYLVQSANVRRVFVCCDARRERPTDLDESFIEYCIQSGLEPQLVWTKVDKANRLSLQPGNAARLALPPIFTSSKRGTGLDGLREAIGDVFADVERTRSS